VTPPPPLFNTHARAHVRSLTFYYNTHIRLPIRIMYYLRSIYIYIYIFNSSFFFIQYIKCIKYIMCACVCESWVCVYVCVCVYSEFAHDTTVNEQTGDNREYLPTTMVCHTIYHYTCIIYSHAAYELTLCDECTLRRSPIVVVV